MEKVFTGLGEITFSATSKGIAKIRFGKLSQASQELQKGFQSPSSLAPSARVKPFLEELRLYFSGSPTPFLTPVDLEAGTSFQQKIWRAIQAIPYGETRSYSWIARKAGHPKAIRAAANACGANPAPVLIPCHRVVSSDGTLGGFSGPLEWKKRLLALEGVVI